MTSGSSLPGTFSALASATLRTVPHAPVDLAKPLADRATILLRLAELSRTDPTAARTELAANAKEQAAERPEAKAIAEAEAIASREFAELTAVWRIMQPEFMETAELVEWKICFELMATPARIVEMIEAGKKVQLEIKDSSGGDGRAVAKFLELVTRHNAYGDARVHGFACSATALLFVCWPGRRIICKDGRLMLHGPSGFVLGDATRLRQKALALEAHTENWVSLLMARTGQRRETCASWLAGPDVWFDAKGVLANGLADEIVESAGE
jgi:ATP-dependent protease ClpP protease subunit